MTSITAIHEALTDTLKTITSLNVGLAKQGVYPRGIVALPSGTYDATFGSTSVYGDTAGSGLVWPVSVFVGTQILDDAYRTLARYIDTAGDQSVRAALMADRTLGSVVHDTYVMSWQIIEPSEADGFGSIGVEFAVKILARKDA